MEPQSSAKPSDNTTDSPYATSNLRRAHTVTQGGTRRNVVAKNLESSREEEDKEDDNEGLAPTRAPTADSPLRTRGSHELLQQQQQQQSSLSPLKRSLTQRGPRDAPSASGGRSRNHFTVGSVGQNGKIFLRYACDNWKERKRRISNEKTGFVC